MSSHSLKIFFSTLFFLFVHFISAQITDYNINGDLNVLYRNEASGSFYIHSGGLGINLRRGFHVTGEKKRMLELDVCSMRDQKEIKLAMNENSKGYYYGKLNSLYILRTGVGKQIVLFRRGDRRSVEIRYSTIVGGSICFAKPVYLDILHSTQGMEPMPLSTERYDPEIHNQSNIYGRANFLTGLNRTKIYPGGYAKFNVSCEFGEDYSDVKALEVGLVADVYPFPVPLMAFNDSKPYFLSLYASLVIGKKWY
ncbi:MAG: hypothetical protein ACK5D5_01635 [Bacteroidota bacterium]